MRDPRDRVAKLESVISKWKPPGRRIDPAIFDVEARTRLVKVGQLYFELLQRDRKEAGEILGRLRAENRQRQTTIGHSRTSEDGQK
jgi:hypothetical protein